MNPKISVISPIYNAAQYLDRFFESLLGQTFADFELICVDDGSTDESAEIIEGYTRRDSRVSLIRQANGGAGAARNAGLDAATGDFLSFIDCDDFFERDMYRLMLEAATSTDADICVCASDAYISDEDIYRAHKRSFVKDYMPEQRVFSYTDAPDYIFNMFRGWAWDKLYKADFVKSSGLRFQEIANLNDAFFVYASLIRARRITTVDRVLVHKSEHLYDSVSASSAKKWDDSRLAYGKLRDWLVSEGVFETVERSFANRVLRNAIWNLGILSGEGLEQIYASLQGGWLSEFGVTADRDAAYWHDPGDYEELTHILHGSLPDYLLFKLEKQNARWRRRFAELKASPTFRAGKILTSVPGWFKRIMKAER
ncbi:MAG: glycosyltransferase [Clostridiales Family XIII bacterium]|jgi:glycosyltransferase involved in cell wall biosynthesis|nr:glycosyltransferase [Clostridiales Family XIII bacterium]